MKKTVIFTLPLLLIAPLAFANTPSTAQINYVTQSCTANIVASEYGMTVPFLQKHFFKDGITQPLDNLEITCSGNAGLVVVDVGIGTLFGTPERGYILGPDDAPINIVNGKASWFSDSQPCGLGTCTVKVDFNFTNTDAQVNSDIRMNQPFPNAPSHLRMGEHWIVAE